MTMRVQASLILFMALAMMGLASCDHYVCSSGPNLGTACTTTGSGLSSGTGGSGTGTGTGSSSGTPTTFIFSGITTLSGISGFTFSAAATNIYPTPDYTLAAAPSGGGGELIVAQGKYLYGSFYGTGLNGQVYGWSIDSTGNLTPISGSPFALPGWDSSILGSIATNPAGTMLFRANPGAFQGDATIYAMQIGAGGILTQVAGSPFPISYSPGAMTTDGQGKYLYVHALAPTGATLEIGAYSIASSGALNAVVGSPFPYQMSEVVGDASGQYLIGTTGGGTSGTDPHLYVFGIQQTGSSAGAISPVAGSPFPTVYTPYSIALQPNSGGVFLYSFPVLTFGTNTPPIEGYQLNPSTGALTAVIGSPFLNFFGSNGYFDQGGNYLFVQNATTLTAYQVSSTGELTGEGSLVQGWGSIAIADVP